MFGVALFFGKEAIAVGNDEAEVARARKVGASIIDLVEDAVAEREPGRLIAVSAVPTPDLALEVQRALIPGDPGAAELADQGQAVIIVRGSSIASFARAFTRMRASAAASRARALAASFPQNSAGVDTLTAVYRRAAGSAALRAARVCPVLGLTRWVRPQAVQATASYASAPSSRPASSAQP